MNTNPSAYRILCFGDSNTWGSKDTQDEYGRYSVDVRWTGVLQSTLGSEYEVIEDGVGGRTLATSDPSFFDPDARNGMASIGSVLHAQRPLDLVILQLGTNDLKREYNYSVIDIADHLAGMIDFIQGYDYKGYSIGNVLVNAPIHYADRKDRLTVAKMEIVEAFAKVAHEKGCFFLDLNEVGIVGEDGVHYSAETHRKIGEALAQKVRLIQG